MPETTPLIRIADCRHGRMMYLRTDKYVGQSLALYGEYCESEAEVFAQLLGPGQVAVEIGANIGAHTVYLSQLTGAAGQVYAFEPQRVIFQILCANIALNEAFNVRTLHAGAGFVPGILQVPYIDYHSDGSNFGGVTLRDNAEGEDVHIIPLDTMVFPSLRLLKIDVEGMEGQVLAGARKQIGRHRPVIYVENDRRDASAALIAQIEDYGYDMWWHFAPLFNPDNFNQLAEDRFNKTVSINLLCVPKEENFSIIGFHKVTGPEDWYQDLPC